MAISSERVSAGENRRLLCILGMHRSGTSVTTQLLHRLGASIAPELVAAIDGVNDDGFWEDSRVVQLNERLLQARGLHWYDLAAPPASEGCVADDAIRGEAISHFIGNYAGPGTWVVKDPRLCRLLPFWLDVWRAAGLDPFFVQTLRHPYAVARSLQRRDRIPCEYGVVLWLLHTLESLSHSVGQLGTMVVFEEFVRQPIRLPQMLARQYGISFSVEELHWQGIVDATVKGAPRLSDPDLGESLGLRELMAFSVSVYESLRAFEYGTVDRELLVSLANSLQELLERYHDELCMLQRMALEMMDLSAESVRIGELHSRALAVIQEKDAAIAERNQIIKDMAYFRFWRLVPRLIRRISGQ